MSYTAVMKERWQSLIETCSYKQDLEAAIEQWGEGTVSSVLDAFLFQIWETSRRWREDGHMQFLEALFQSGTAEQFMRRAKGIEPVPQQ